MQPSKEELKHLTASFSRVPDERTRYFFSMLLDAVADNIASTQTNALFTIAEKMRRPKHDQRHTRSGVSVRAAR